ncbi:MAG TPA: hypothetical protein VF165_16400 [Nocardioidaceae bacterium]
MADAPGCGGVWLTQNSVVCITGRASAHGERIIKSASRAALKKRNADFTDDWSERVTVLVWGDFSRGQIVNPRRGLTQKLEEAHAARIAGRHVHVIDTDDYGALLEGRRVPCVAVPDPRRLRAGGLKRPRAMTQMSPPGAGRPAHTTQMRPYEPQKGPTRNDVLAMTKDLAALERALQAHRHIEMKLAELARNRGLAPLSPAAEPTFDVAWLETDDSLTVVEVKSLPPGCEVQQLRLGLGQVCDYREQLKSRHAKVRAVLAVERKPPAHWDAVCRAADVILVWPPRLGRAFKPKASN